MTLFVQNVYIQLLVHNTLQAKLCLHEPKDARHLTSTPTISFTSVVLLFTATSYMDTLKMSVAFENGFANKSDTNTVRPLLSGHLLRGHPPLSGHFPKSLYSTATSIKLPRPPLCSRK